MFCCGGIGPCGGRPALGGPLPTLMALTGPGPGGGPDIATVFLLFYAGASAGGLVDGGKERVALPIKGRIWEGTIGFRARREARMFRRVRSRFEVWESRSKRRRPSPRPMACGVRTEVRFAAVAGGCQAVAGQELH